MKRLITALLLVFTSSAGMSGESDVLVRSEFVGFDQIAAQGNKRPIAAKWTKIWTNSNSVAFRTKMLRRTGRIPQLLLGDRLADREVDYSLFFQGAADELLTKPTYFLWRKNPNAPDHTEWVLAAEVGRDRTHRWDTNCWNLLESWKLGSLERQSGGGNSKIASWKSSIEKSAHAVRFARWHDWILVGSGSHEFPLFDETLEKARKGNLLEQGEAWFKLDASFPAMRRVWPSLQEHNLPDIQMHLTPLEKHVKTDLTADLSRPVDWDKTDWNLPEELINEPLGSFTAGKGIRNLWSKFFDFNDEAPPNQFFLWSQSRIPFQTFAAVPVSNPTNRIHALADQKLDGWSQWAKSNKLGKVLWVTNRTEIFWRGLPAITPFLRPFQPEGKENGYLMGGLFPPLVSGDPVPEELYQQVRGRNDLLYYSWEITQTRLEQLQQLIQLLYMVFTERKVALVSPGQSWIRTVAPELGNTITEVVATSPKQLKLTRRSHIGLNSIELMILALLEDDPAYPDGFFTGQNLPLAPVKSDSQPKQPGQPKSSPPAGSEKP